MALDAGDTSTLQAPDAVRGGGDGAGRKEGERKEEQRKTKGGGEDDADSACVKIEKKQGTRESKARVEDGDAEDGEDKEGDLERGEREKCRVTGTAVCHVM